MAKGSVNKVILLGRLGRDPEVIETPGGMKIASVALATTELGRKDQATGQRGEDITEWHRLKMFGKTAELAGQYLKKGSKLYIEGRNQTQKWQDKEGNDRYTTEVIVNEMQFMGEKGDSNSGQAQQPAPQPKQQPAAPQQAQSSGFDDEDDEIPF